MEPATVPPAASAAKRTIHREPKALLLAGGALCLAAAIGWLACYRPISDPLPHVAGPDAVFSLSIVGRPHDLEKLIGSLPPEALVEVLPILASQTSRTVLTVAATRNPDETLAWSADIGSRLRKSKILWIRRKSDGFGLLSVPASGHIRFEFRLKEGFAVATVGRVYAGLFNGLKSIPGTPAKIAALIPKSFGAYFHNAHEHLSWPQTPFSPYFEPLLRRSDEFAIGTASSSPITRQFAARGRMPRSTAGREAFFGELKRLIAFLDPEEVRHELPDGSAYLERTSVDKFVKMEKRSLRLGELTRLRSGSGIGEMYVFEDQDGTYWLGNSLDAVQQALFAATVRPDITNECVPENGRSGSLFITERLQALVPETLVFDAYLRFPLMSFVLNDAETGLFTICGYIGK